MLYSLYFNCGNRPGVFPTGVWPFVPVGPVLPRVQGVVQAGAHGMNSLVLAAGKPSVIVPALFDQLWHARRHEELGTGIRVRGRVTVAKLRVAIEAALTTETTSHAREFGARLATEDGVANACNEIEGFLNRS